MRKHIQKLSRPQLVFIITLVAVCSAVILDFTISSILNHQYIIEETIIRVVSIPLIITPFLSWYLVGFMFNLDRLEKKMSLLATYDDLTKLLNRRAFYHSCESIDEYSIQNEKNYCLLIIDLDDFKKINDQYGHIAGDAVLASFGHLSKSLARNSDVLGRIGGEEFGILLPGTELKQAENFADRLRKETQDTEMTHEGKQVLHTISIGISVKIHDQKLSFQQVMANADHALYIAKNNGRNKVEVFQHNQ